MELSGLIILIGLFLYFKILIQHSDNTGKTLLYGTIIFLLMSITITACQLMAFSSRIENMPYQLKFDPTNILSKNHVNVNDFIPKYYPDFNAYSPETSKSVYKPSFPLTYM